jgi:hypothetical protein
MAKRSKRIKTSHGSSTRMSGHTGGSMSKWGRFSNPTAVTGLVQGGMSRKAATSLASTGYVENGSLAKLPRNAYR